MQTMGKRRAPERVQMTFEVSQELRHGVKLMALMRGMTVREYLTDLVARDQAKEEATSKYKAGPPAATP